MRPNRRRIMVRTAARARRKVAVRLTASTSSQSSSLSWTNRLSRVIPAFATRMSSLPIASSAFGTSASTSAMSARLHGSTWVRSLSSPASASSASRRVPDSATVAPWPCNARAMAPPMPPVAPVTSAVLPVRSNIGRFLNSLLRRHTQVSMSPQRVAKACRKAGTLLCTSGAARCPAIPQSSIYWRAALNAATSSGVPIDTPLAPSAIRLTRPLRTLPAPSS